MENAAPAPRATDRLYVLSSLYLSAPPACFIAKSSCRCYGSVLRYSAHPGIVVKV
jgi:hypothetical protein